jgi:GrpB-like predicted nucleotidyltransferase (UPF0157 family)
MAFRDYLRTHTGHAQECERLKLHLAAIHRHDREAYTQGKSDFVRSTLEFARAQG